jgi:tetratricopeptide (TPR) repeat protein
MATEPRRLAISPYLQREPVTLALLALMAVAFFSAVGGLSRVYHAQQSSLADRWASRGVNDLNAHRYNAAGVDFHTALLYDRDNGAYQLSLAESLLGLHRFDEAHAYLINLWEREPDNGLVSLELARIAVHDKQTNQALRFYHNAIYATWPGNPDEARRRARLELIHYLLSIGANAQAEAELIDLAATVGDDASRQTELGQLFLQVGDHQRALAAFRLGLRLNPDDQPALAGAGQAAFAMGMYPVAQRYLGQAIAASPFDAASAERLKLTQFVLTWDPFRQIPILQRDKIVIDAFNTAGARLKTCTTPSATIQTLRQSWSSLNPQINLRALRANPDLVNTAMNLVFQIERQTQNTCAKPSDADQALFLIANLHEEG